MNSIFSQAKDLSFLVNQHGKLEWFLVEWMGIKLNKTLRNASRKVRAIYSTLGQLKVLKQLKELKTNQFQQNQLFYKQRKFGY